MSAFHLAGVVPVAGQPLDFDFPWHDSLQPIGQNYLAVERAVVECAYAGCNTIWVVCNDDMQPLIRHRLGEYIQDPVFVERRHYHGPTMVQKQIPIYYVPIHSKDLGKRDCLSWSVLYGALTAYHISKKISKWTVPQKFYTAFPYGVYDPAFVREHRRVISSAKNFFISHEGKTVRDNEYLGFSFGEEEFIEYRKIVRREGTGRMVPGQEYGGREELPLHERWSARNFTLDKVFGSAILEDSNVVEAPWYKRIDNWDGLRDFLSSEFKLERPSKKLFSYKEWNPIGEDREELDESSG